MGCKPGAVGRCEIPGHGLGVSRRCESVDVGRDFRSPSSGIVIGPGDSPARFLQRPYVVHQRGHAFVEVSKIRRPVVHLDVDVVVVVRIPGALYLVAPDSLQVRRHVSFARRSYQKITSVLEIESLQPRIRMPLTVLVEPVRRRQRACGRMAELQIHPLVKFLIICKMAAQEPLPAEFRRRFYAAGCKHAGIFPLVICSGIRQVRVEIHLVVRCRSHQENDLGGSGNGDRPVFGHKFPSPGQGLYTEGELFAVVLQAARIQDAVVPVGNRLPGGNRILLIFQAQIQRLLPVGGKPYGHYLVGIRHEVLTLVRDAILPESDTHKGGIQGKRTLVRFHRLPRPGFDIGAEFFFYRGDATVIHLVRGLVEIERPGSLAQSGIYEQFSQSGHVAETVYLPAAFDLLRHRTEILPGQFPCKLVVAFKEGLPNIRKYGGGRLVAIPVIRRVVRHGRPPCPQAFLVESQTFAGYGSHHVGPQGTIAYGQRLRFPFIVRTPGPYRSGAGPCGHVEPNPFVTIRFRTSES